MTIADIEAFRREHAAWIASAHAAGSAPCLAGAYTNGAMCYAFFGLHEEAETISTQALRFSRGRTQPAQRGKRPRVCGDVLPAARRSAARATELDQVPATSENRVNITFATAWGTVIGAALDDHGTHRKMVRRVRSDDLGEAGSRVRRRLRGDPGATRALPRRGGRSCIAPFPSASCCAGTSVTLLAVGRYGAACRPRARARVSRAGGRWSDRVTRALGAGAVRCDRMPAARGHGDDGMALARDAADGFRRLRFPLFEAAALEVAGETEAALAHLPPLRRDVRRPPPRGCGGRDQRGADNAGAGC